VEKEEEGIETKSDCMCCGNIVIVCALPKSVDRVGSNSA
jgi:hypothetical protein